MLGFYNYTVILTYISLISGVFGMFFAVTGMVNGATLCLLFSGFCDLFDGKIARTKKDRTDQEKRFGIQIDSLNDIVCFGVLPAMICVAVGCDKIWHACIAAFFVLCGLIRLAYFNVTEEDRQKKTTENRKTYTGLPITSSSIIIPFLLCFKRLFGEMLPEVYVAALFIMAVLFISPITVKKPLSSK